MTIDSIQFSNLKPYDGKNARSFELMIFRLMCIKYQGKGKFTAIAGSGGDGGIEFYMTLENGDVWGWQCKYYEDNGRLAASKRKEKIEESLATACRNYPLLKKWTLCLKTNLTVAQTDKNGKVTKGEQDWFADTLPLQIPAGHSVLIEFIGEDEILNMLGDPLYTGIKTFFFGELEVDQGWFHRQCEGALNKTKNKYDPVLHTIDQFQQSIIDSALLNPGYKTLLSELCLELVHSEPAILQDIYQFSIKVVHNPEDEAIKDAALSYFEEFEDIPLDSFEIFGQLEKHIEQFDTNAIDQLIVQERESTRIADYFNACPDVINQNEAPVAKFATAIYRSMHKFFEEYDRIFRNYIHHPENHLIFLGDAAAGKTHVSCDIVYKRLELGLPAIFLTGDSFNNESNLEAALLKLLDIPAVYSFETLLQTLDTYGQIAKAKVPIVIDGLNETVFGQYFSSIWRSHYHAFSSKIKKTDNLILIVTCRNSYKNEIWEDTSGNAFHYLDGFYGYDVTLEAVGKYFNKYRIKSDLTFANLERFKKPIFLKIFCEIKNPDWNTGEEVQVNIQSDSNNDLFSAYLKLINEKVTRESPLLRRGEPFIQSSMEKIAASLWINNLRELPVQDFYDLIDGVRPYRFGESKADLLIQEGLVLTKDIRSGGEYISVTFELIAGYIIAKYLLYLQEPGYLLPQGPFHQKVKRHSQPHPLYENIVGELSLLMPQVQQTMLHDYYGLEQDDYIHYISITSLWKLPGILVRPEDVELVENYFLEVAETRQDLIYCFKITLAENTHPLNSLFSSQLLFKLSVKDRDLSWSEYIRRGSWEWIIYLEEITRECRGAQTLAPLAEMRLHLIINFFQWFLTSTDRKMRDTATRTLYFYGIRYPEQLMQLVFKSLECNDPYVSERMLAALYGVVLAKFGINTDPNFRDKLSPKIATTLYNLMFRENAPFYTTHELARDYASRSILLALNVWYSTAIDYERLISPFPQSQQLEFPVHEDGVKSFGGPIGMDFGNYTIGHIVKGGFSYSNPPEKIKVRGQIYSRIYQLGWNESDFGKVDKNLEDRYQSERNQRPLIERYGKKYSWIAFMEISGYRRDMNLLDDDFGEYRTSDADLDPSFPEKAQSDQLAIKDFLGDRSLSLIDWLQHGGLPPVNPYLEIEDDQSQWVCLDGYINQTDQAADRASFTFIRGMIIQSSDMPGLLQHLEKQRLGGRWIPEIRENYYTYAGELYLFPDATHSNSESLSFELSRKKKRVKKGEHGYHPSVRTVTRGNKIIIKTHYPESKVVDDVTTADFDILLPVMEYNWGGRSPIEKAGRATVVSCEIADALKLMPDGRNFDLYSTDGTKATNFKEHRTDSGNNNRLIYLRKDLLDKYLAENDCQLIWGIWGEREPSLETDLRTAFKAQHNIDDIFEFQRVVTYKNDNT